jgi:xanthine dehydrogenase accessory factor
MTNDQGTGPLPHGLELAPGVPHVHEDGTECSIAHGEVVSERPADRHLVAVYASDMATYLLAWGRELGFDTALLEPEPVKVTDAHRANADAVLHDPAEVPIDTMTDVVVTDHHRNDLGPVMAPLLKARPRWLGIMGSPRHVGPHAAALGAEGIDPALIATVHRPIGLDIGSKAPAEIALSTLAGLLADRNGRSGGTPHDVAATR